MHLLEEKEKMSKMIIIMSSFVFCVNFYYKLTSCYCKTVSMIIPLYINNKTYSQTMKDKIVGFEVLTVEAMKNSVIPDLLTFSV